MKIQYVLSSAIFMLAATSCASSAQKQITSNIQPTISSGDYKNSSALDKAINDDVDQMLISQGLDSEEVVKDLEAAGISIATLQKQVKAEVEYQRSAK